VARSLPAILEYCRLADELAPGAWIYNFTNPAGLVAQGLAHRLHRPGAVVARQVDDGQVVMDRRGIDPRRLRRESHADAEGQRRLVVTAVGRRELSDVIVRDRDTNVNLLSFVAPNSRRDRRISDADIRAAFDKTKRFDMVIVAAVDVSRDPSARFFAGLVDHIVLVARADERDEEAAELLVARLGADAKKVRGTVLTGVAAA